MTRAAEAHSGQHNSIQVEPGAAQPRARRPGVFRSFWIAGVVGGGHLNGRGIALAPGQATQHLDRLEEDYCAVAALGVRTVRESIGWRMTETRPRTYDFSSLERMARAAHAAGLQVIWTLMHYGWPADLDIFSPRFAERFAHFADAAARCLRRLSPDIPFFAPVNEISFLSWALSSTGIIQPYDGSLQEHGFRVKRQLVRAAVRGCEAIWNVDPRARLVHGDPLIHIVAPRDRPDLAQEAQRHREHQFQAWDMLAGTLEPELGGSRRLLDIVGAHYYHGNQWEHGGELLHWHLRDPRRAALSQLLGELHARYRRPLALLETGHFGAGRAQWLEEIADEVLTAEGRGVPVEGICLYPAIDRPDWSDPDHWHHSGLWDLVREPDGALRRVLNADYAKALRRCQQWLPDARPLADQPDSSRTPTIVVFSHLRWDFVFQRPQHLMSRFARDHRIVFVEEPVHHPELAFLERWTPCANLEVLRPHTPVHADGFHDEQLPVLAQLLDEFLHRHAVVPDAAWLYTPMALPLATRIAPRRIVYDCMDELAAFKSAPRQLVQRENALLRVADVVFTGGPSLHRAKCDRHPAVHCFPSSVDEAHFAQAKRVPSHPAQAAIGSPRLGFFGVIDERMDFRLIEALADARRDWQVVMVGPVAKIDPEMLPQRPNLHWLGQRGYDELPGFLAGWDVCLLPFALNDATRHISPTKTPEYLAAGKPVVSTALTDVNELYGHLVRIAHDAPGFIEHCKAALEEPVSVRAQRQAQSAELFVRTSWERTVQSMRALVFATGAGERRRMPARPDAVPEPTDFAADGRAGAAQARSA